MDLGLHYFTFTHPEWETTLADTFTETAQIADEGGMNLMSVMDHWFQMLTLRLVAQYAQACNLFAGPGDEALETVRHKLEVLREHCDSLGTDYDAIEKTILYQGDAAADVDAFLKDMERYAKLGVTLVSLMPTPYENPAPWATRLVEDVVPRLKQV